jgi:hypothetical protein
MNDLTELANNLLKKGVAKTWLDAQRMAESMVHAKPFEPSLATRAEKYYDKKNPVNTNLNLHNTQQFTTQASASEVSALREELAEHKRAIQHILDEIAHIKELLPVNVHEVQVSQATLDEQAPTQEQVDVSKMFYAGRQ